MFHDPHENPPPHPPSYLMHDPLYKSKHNQSDQNLLKKSSALCICLVAIAIRSEEQRYFSQG